MKLASLITAAILLASSGTMAHAAASVATWTNITPTEATATLDGVTITATPSAATGSTNWGVAFDRLSLPFWQASDPLPIGSEALGVNGVEGGESMQFDFTAGLTSVLVYIENLDGGLVADVVATGATAMNFISGSSSIEYEMTSATTGVLTTNNGTFNGEGEALIEILGPVSSLSFDFTAGAFNAVFYGFATEGGDPPVEPPAVPEPASLAIWTALLGLGAVIVQRRRRK